MKKPFMPDAVQFGKAVKSTISDMDRLLETDPESEKQLREMLEKEDATERLNGPSAGRPEAAGQNTPVDFESMLGHGRR